MHEPKYFLLKEKEAKVREGIMLSALKHKYSSLSPKEELSILFVLSTLLLEK